MDSPDGLLVIDKPGGVTSRDAVNTVQAWLPPRTRIGHTGTLDPLATGVLVVCIGQATRLAEYVQAMPKQYRSTFLLGAQSDTDDADGQITRVEGVTPIELSRVEAALRAFAGEIEQTPPAHSAAKVAGRRAYKLARRGQPVELQPRRVTVYSIEIIAYDWPRLDVEVRCGKGTYIRSLARDLGFALGCGGLVETLRRTQVGPFRVEDAVALDTGKDAALARLRPMSDAVAQLPRIDVTGEQVARLRNGQAIADEATGEVALYSDGTLVAVAVGHSAKKLLQPTKVFAMASRAP